jgi:predicted RNA-binding protein with PIN domain
MHYWIDGYNFFFRISKNYAAMRKQEKILLQKLYQSMTLLKSPMTIVFDGKIKDPPEAIKENLLEMNLIYTPAGQTADQYILKMLDDCFKPSEQIIVSSDSELLYCCKQKGAKVQTVESFIEKLRHRLRPHQRGILEKKQQKESSYHFQRLLDCFEREIANFDSRQNDPTL